MRGENIDLQAGGLLGWSKISTQLLAVLLIEREGGTASKIWIQSRFGIELGQVPSTRARTRLAKFAVRYFLTAGAIHTREDED